MLPRETVCCIGFAYSTDAVFAHCRRRRRRVAGLDAITFRLKVGSSDTFLYQRRDSGAPVLNRRDVLGASPGSSPSLDL